MSEGEDRRRRRGAAEEGAGEDLVSLDLRAELSAEELESFKAEARKAGRSLEEHFKAITIGEGKAGG